MKNAVIIHGYNDESEYLDVRRPAASNDHWLPWLQRQLSLHGVETQTPEMPGFYQPRYEAWKTMLERFEPNEDTILVGHSCGAGFLVRWLSETKKKVGTVMLVAPWLDPKRTIGREFFNFMIDPAISSRTKGLTIMYSADDDESVLESVRMLKSQLKSARFQKFTNKGHFVLNSLHSDKLPELLENILKDEK